MKKPELELPVCSKCGAMGTIVEMRLCCKVLSMDCQYSVLKKFHPLPPSRTQGWRPHR